MKQKWGLLMLIGLLLGGVYLYDEGCVRWYEHITNWSEVFEKLMRGRGQWQVACLYGVLQGLCVTALAPYLVAYLRQSTHYHAPKIAAWKIAIAIPAAVVMVVTLKDATLRPYSENWLQFSLAAFLETCLATAPLWLCLQFPDEKH